MKFNVLATGALNFYANEELYSHGDKNIFISESVCLELYPNTFQISNWFELYPISDHVLSL